MLNYCLYVTYTQDVARRERDIEKNSKEQESLEKVRPYKNQS